MIVQFKNMKKKQRTKVEKAGETLLHFLASCNQGLMIYVGTFKRAESAIIVFNVYKGCPKLVGLAHLSN